MRTELLQSPLNKDTTEKEMDAKRAPYTGNSGERRRATMFTCYSSRSCSSTYMASAFGLDKGVSLADIIGTDGLDEKMQRRTLTINQK
jgi:hypothetical protein